MLGQFLKGSRYIVYGLNLITRPGLRHYALWPVAINTLLFLFLVYQAVGWFEGVTNWLFDFIPQGLQWLEWLLWPLFILATLFIVFSTFSLVMNLIASPFNSILAARVEIYLTGTRVHQESGMPGFAREAIHALRHELRKMAYMGLRAIPLLLLFLVPGLNLVAIVLWSLFSTWMLAVEYLDYPVSNRGGDFALLRSWMAQQRPLALGFGSATLLFTVIPIVNFLVMPAAVAGATSMYVEQCAPPE